jgi:hypothetical protein
MKESETKTKEETMSFSEALGNIQIQKIALQEQQIVMLERIAKALEKKEDGVASSKDDDFGEEDEEEED